MLASTSKSNGFVALACPDTFSSPHSETQSCRSPPCQLTLYARFPVATVTADRQPVGRSSIAGREAVGQQTLAWLARYAPSSHSILRSAEYHALLPLRRRLVAFFAHVSEQLVYLHCLGRCLVLHLMRQLLVSSIYPVNYRLKVDAQRSAYRAEAVAFQVHTNGCFFELWVMTHWFGAGSEVALASLASHTLRAGTIQSCLLYSAIAPAVRTRWVYWFFHAITLPPSLPFVTPNASNFLTTPR